MVEIVQNDVLEHYKNALRDRRKYSNCYLSMAEIQKGIEQNCICAYDSQDSLILINQTNGSNDLYFFSESWDWLKDIKLLKDKYGQLVVSIVQHKADDLNKRFDDYGFTVYRLYRRLRRQEYISDNSSLLPDIHLLEKDIPQLLKIISDTFDVIGDHIPTKNELKDFIDENLAIGLKEGDTIKGFLLFEDKGRTSYIRMICVSKQYRGIHAADDLMKSYLGIHESFKSFTLWYDIKNTPAYTLYKKWGYEEEDMFNYIYVI